MRFSVLRHLDALLFKSRPIQLTFFLTRRCNAHCPFCFYLSRAETAHQAQELSLDEIDQMASSLGNLLWLALSGGEPFLRQDLVRVVDIFYRHNRPAIILLPTNGLMPGIIARQTEAILKACPGSVVVVKVSLDGPKPLHDTLRGVAGAFDKATATCRLLATLAEQHDNLELGVNTVFCRANQDVMEETIQLVGRMHGIRTHTISLIRGDVGERALKDVDMDRYRRTIDLVESNLKGRHGSGYRFPGSRLKSAQDILQRRFIHRVRMEHRQVISCLAGRLTLVVTESGDVYPCESFTDRLGNIRENGYDLGKISTSRHALGIIEQIRARRCFCTHECYMMMNILFNLRTYPALCREYLALRNRH